MIPSRKQFDASRGVGTYEPITAGDAARFKQNIPGVSQNNTRSNYERRANTKIPGFGENPYKTMRDMPGSGSK